MLCKRLASAKWKSEMVLKDTISKTRCLSNELQNNFCSLINVIRFTHQSSPRRVNLAEECKAISQPRGLLATFFYGVCKMTLHHRLSPNRYLFLPSTLLPGRCLFLRLIGRRILDLYSVEPRKGCKVWIRKLIGRFDATNFLLFSTETRNILNLMECKCVHREFYRLRSGNYQRLVIEINRLPFKKDSCDSFVANWGNRSFLYGGYLLTHLTFSDLYSNVWYN